MIKLDMWKVVQAKILIGNLMPKPVTLPNPWTEIVNAYGGRRSFAEKIGVSEITVYRWAHKMSKMSSATQKEVIRLAKAKGLKIERL